MSSTAAGVIFIATLVVALAAAYRPLGDYMYRVVTSAKHVQSETDVITLTSLTEYSRCRSAPCASRTAVCGTRPRGRWGRGTWLVVVDPVRRRNSSVPTAAQGFPLALVPRERDRALVRRVRGVAGPPQELGPHRV